MQDNKGWSKTKAGLRGLACAAGWLGLHLPAQAVGLNQMSATAYENTVVTDLQTSGVSLSMPVTAAVSNGDGQAFASATVLQLTTSASSLDVQTNHFDGDAAQFSSFTFWNTATNTAYSAADLSGRSLTLQFSLAGEVTMPGAPEGGNARSTGYSYSAAMYTINPVGQAGGGSISCGPSGCVNTGDPLHLGINQIDTHFALTGAITAASGLLDTHLYVIDGGGTNSSLTLGITGAFLSGDAVPPLALRFEDGNQLAVITAVPEPASCVLMMSGVAALLATSRGGKRQRRA